MPRNPGTGVYTAPIPDAVPLTTIASSPYNVNFHDVETDLNAPRPIVAGGTGASNAVDARHNIGAEAALQGPVTNYDTFPFEPGSFWSNPGATAAPNANPLYGICYQHGNPAYMTIEVTDTAVPANTFIRHKVAGVWSAWETENFAAGISSKVAKAGDTMTGVLYAQAGVAHGVNPAFKTYQSGNDYYRWWAQTYYQHWSEATGTWRVVQNSTERFSITFGGNILLNGPMYWAGPQTGAPGVGNTTTGGVIDNGGNGAFVTVSRAAAATIYANVNADGANIVLNRSGAQVGSISVTTTATAYNTSSDERLKEDLQTFDASRVIDQTKVYSFKWKKDPDGERAYGVLAQQAQEVYPAAVTYDKANDWYGIDYSKYIPVVLQELQALRARVAQLEGMLDKLA